MDSIKNLPEPEFGKAILVMLNRQSLGHILPSQRGLTVGWQSDHDMLRIVAYFDREPTATDQDAINEIAAEMEAELGFSVSEKRFVIRLETECVGSTKPFAQLAALGCWAHFRYEGDTISYPIPDFIKQATAKKTASNDLLTLAAQQSLVGRIASYTRKITAEIADNAVHFEAYTDTPNNEKQHSLLLDAAREVSVLLSLPNIPRVNCTFAQGSYADLGSLAVTPYLRYESEMGYFPDE